MKTYLRVRKHSKFLSEKVKELKKQSLLKNIFKAIKNFVALKQWTSVMKERANNSYNKQL